MCECVCVMYMFIRCVILQIIELVSQKHIKTLE